MKKQILQSDENGVPYTQFPEMIELMEMQEKLHEQGEKQKKNELIDLNQTYLYPVKKPLMVILILFFVSITAIFAQNSDCDSFLKVQKDYSSLSFMDTWTKNTSPYSIKPISSKEIEVSYSNKKDTLSFYLESEVKMIKSQNENLEIIVLTKEPKIIRTYHFARGINLKKIIPYNDGSCLRQKISKEEVLLSNPSGDSIFQYNTEKNIFILFKKCKQ